MAVHVFGTSYPRADFFDFNLKFLFYVGLWPDENRLSNQLYRIYQYSLFIGSIIFLISTGIGTYMSKDDVIRLLSNVDKVTITYNYFFKIMIFLIKHEQIKCIISSILHSGDQIDVNRKYLMKIHVVMVTLLVTSITGAFQFLAQIKGELIMDAWFPFEPKKNKLTFLAATLIISILFVLPFMFRAIAIQGIVCSVVMYLCDQLVELQRRLKALKYSVESETYLREEFKDILKKHIRLMEYSKSIKSAFNEFFLVQNLAITAELCLNALMMSLIGLEQKNHLVSFMAFLIMALFNAFIFCHLGNNLIDESAGISLAAYESTWTSWPVDLQRDLLIVITVAQKSLSLTAGGIADMSMQTYAQALYNGYSIFAVLRDVVN
ncbi:odorant receptor 4-like [Ostrinia furnacalis]|uniref:odorant receptor 4-like n=1 Tax=Ostrinia furnacalis TaxID=93504 RepID=UPI00103BBC3C|nr:odorant receptor 4-like [Ostrinia furnacalis]